MPADLHQIIAAICSEVFCDPLVGKEVKRILREGATSVDLRTCLLAAQVAKPREPNGLDLKRLQEMNPFDLPGFEDPVGKHTLVYLAGRTPHINKMLTEAFRSPPAKSLVVVGD